MPQSPPTAQYGFVPAIRFILVLYTALVLWPSYASGLAWFKGDPKFDPHPPVHLWYYSDIFPLNYLTIPIVAIAVITAQIAWVLLPTLGVATIRQLLRDWSELDKSKRWVAVGVGVLAIVVVPLTWTASQQFVRWVLD